MVATLVWDSMTAMMATTTTAIPDGARESGRLCNEIEGARTYNVTNLEHVELGAST